MNQAYTKVDPLPPQRVKEAGQKMLEGLARVLAAKSEDEAKAAFVAMLGEAAEVLSIPAFQHARALGLASGSRDATAMTGSVLKQLRQAAGVTQAEMGFSLGVPQTNVSDWEKGVRGIPAKHIAKIRERLFLTPPHG